MRGAVPLPARTRTQRFRDAVAAHAPQRDDTWTAHPVWPEFVRQANESEVAAAARQRESRKGGGRR